MRGRWIALALCLLVAGVQGAITTYDGTPANAVLLAQIAASDDSIITDASWTEYPASPGADRAAGSSDAQITPEFDWSEFIVLSNGDADSGGDGTYTSTARGANDVVIMAIDIDVPADDNCLRFDFQFLSNEYPQYVGQNYNDAFLAELDANTWSVLSSDIDAPDNFAFDINPATGEKMLISINAAGDATMSAGLASGSGYGGATRHLIAQTEVTPGPHTLYFSIFDDGDSAVTSTVYIANLHTAEVFNPDAQCEAGVTVITDPPTVDFTWTAADPIRTGDPVTFIDNSVADNGAVLSNWEWTFPHTVVDKTDASNVIEAFSSIGMHDVTLTVMDNMGNQASLTKQVEVVNGPPACSFDMSSNSLGLNLMGDFTSTSTDADGGVGLTEWDMGDGATATGTAVSHSYAEVGRYTITLTVTDNMGASSSCTQQVTVSNLPPTISIAGPSRAWTLDPIPFIAEAADPEGGDVEITWFIEGSSSNGETREHTFSRAGRFVVSATATDVGGLETTTTHVIDIIGRTPTASFTIETTGDATSDTWTFTDTSSDPDGRIIDWTWDFGDDHGGHTPEVRHDFAEVGEYQITLTVTDDAGLQSQTTATIEVVNQAPSAQASMTVDDDTVYLQDESFDSDGEVSESTWFVDGVEQKGAAIAVELPAEGEVLVELSVVDLEGGRTVHQMYLSRDSPLVLEAARAPQAATDDPTAPPSVATPTPGTDEGTMDASPEATPESKPAAQSANVMLIVGVALAGLLAAAGTVLFFVLRK